MTNSAENNVTFLADLVDPTPDGILTDLVNFGISGLMVLVALAGAWNTFKKWKGTEGDAALKVVRENVYGILAIEAFLGGVIYLANYGSTVIPGLR